MGRYFCCYKFCLKFLFNAVPFNDLGGPPRNPWQCVWSDPTDTKGSQTVRWVHSRRNSGLPKTVWLVSL